MTNPTDPNARPSAERAKPLLRTCRSAGRPPASTPWVIVVALIATLSTVGGAGWELAHSPGAAAAGGTVVPPSSSVAAPPGPRPLGTSENVAAGATQLEGAEQSLRQGGGPAEGTPLNCTAPSETAGPRCSSGSPTGTAGISSGVGASSAAPASGPDAALGWDIQGAPQGVAYIQYALTWDYYDNYVVLFGGSTQTYSANVYSAATWTYQSGVWTEVYPLIAPQGRDSSGLAYSPWDDAVVLFGGYAPATGGFLNDTWLFKAGQWTQLHINGPSARNGFGLVYDPAVDADVLFGGQSPECLNHVCNDTWEFHYDSWTKVSVKESPPQRWQMSMAYDEQSGDVVLFGGLGIPGACPNNAGCGDTWQFNGTTWQQVATDVLCGTTAEGPCPAADAPSPRHEASMTFDYRDNYLLLFGGWNYSTELLGDTWEFSGGAWTKLAPAASPTGRYGAGMTFDFSPGDDFVLLVDGSPTVYEEPDAIMAFHGGTWSINAPPSTSSPGPVVYGSMAYDAADGYVVFVGGYNSSFGLTEGTWTYAHGVWTHLIGADPFDTFDAAMAYDPGEGYILLFGGGGGVNWTWAFHGGIWTELCDVQCAFGIYAPRPTEGAGLAYEPTSATMVLFGGDAYEGPVVGYQLVSQTWIWIAVSATTGYWENLTTTEGSNVPAPRVNMGMTYDAYNGEIVLYGGGNLTGDYGDTWTMTDAFSGWHEVGACGGFKQPACTDGPNPSAAMVFAYDTALQEVVMSGGQSAGFGGYLLGNTYVFQGTTWLQCSTYSCFGGNYGFGTYDGAGASAYDAADGYVITVGGITWEDNYYLDVGTYYLDPYSWVLGTPITSQGPGFAPEEADAGQSVTFDIGATGGGIGTYSYTWNGLPTGCAPSSATVASFACTVQDDGFTQYGLGNETPVSYFAPSVVVADSSGSPSFATPDSSYWLGWLDVAPDMSVALGSTATVAEVGQTVYFGLNTSYGWGPYHSTWSDLPSGCVQLLTGSASVRETCALTAADVGTFAVQAEVVDATGAAAYSRAIPLTVEPATATTVVASNVDSLDAGQTLTVWVTASGGDGSYSYTWSGVPVTCRANAPELSCVVTPSEVGAYSPSVTVSDGLGASAHGTFPGTIRVDPAPSASALAITNATGAPTGAVDAGSAVTFTLTSTIGSGGDVIGWSGLPGGCSAASTNSTSVACAPTALGTFLVSATITDSNGLSAASPTEPLVVSEVLSGGAVDASTHALDVGQALALSAEFVGGGGSRTFAWSGLPTGCVAANEAVLTCSPTEAGRFSPTVEVHDSVGGTDSATIAAGIVVSPDLVTPSLEVLNDAGKPIGSATTGSTVKFALTIGFNAGGDRIVWSGLPGGCVPATDNSSTVSCSLNVTGTYSVSVTESDTRGDSVTSPAVSLTVTAPTAAAPFATPVQELELGLLGVAVALGAVAVIIAARRPRANPSPPPPPSATGPGSPDWKES